MNQKILESAKHSTYLIRKYGGYQTNPLGVLLQLKLVSLIEKLPKMGYLNLLVNFVTLLYETQEVYLVFQSFHVGISPLFLLRFPLSKGFNSQERSPQSITRVAKSNLSWSTTSFSCSWVAVQNSNVRRREFLRMFYRWKSKHLRKNGCIQATNLSRQKFELFSALVTVFS